MKNKKSKFLLLQLFADGGDGGSATGAETGDNGTDAASQSGEGRLPIIFLDKQQQNSDAGSSTDQEATTTTEENQSEDLEAEYLALIKKGGKFADVHQKHFQSALNERLHSNKEQDEALAKYQRIAQKLSAAYGVSPDDLDGIDKAIDNDNNLYADAAMQQGMSVETFKEVQQTRAEIALMKKAEAERVMRAEADKTFKQWLSEADSLKERYPSFDIETELKNPTFSGLLRNGFTVKNAYEAAHHEEIVAAAVQHTAKEATQRMAKSYASNQTRPDENASSKNAVATVKRNVADLTDDELDEIDRLSRLGPVTLG